MDLPGHPTTHTTCPVMTGCDTNGCMNSIPSTRQRLLDAGLDLFSRWGYRGATVRDICNAARANPGAVSYHFGSKRQLYRATLRRAAEELAESVSLSLPEAPGRDPARATLAAVTALTRQPTTFRLLLRDLAEGGDGAVESFAPLLRSAMEQVLEERGIDHDPTARNATIETVLGTMAPAFLLLVAWPVLHRALDLPEDSMEAWIERLTGRNG